MQPHPSSVLTLATPSSNGWGACRSNSINLGGDNKLSGLVDKAPIEASLNWCQTIVKHPGIVELDGYNQLPSFVDEAPKPIKLYGGRPLSKGINLVIAEGHDHFTCFVDQPFLACAIGLLPLNTRNVIVKIVGQIVLWLPRPVNVAVFGATTYLFGDRR